MKNIINLIALLLVARLIVYFLVAMGFLVAKICPIRAHNTTKVAFKSRGKHGFYRSTVPFSKAFRL